MNELRKTAYFISFPLTFIAFIFPIFASSLGASAMQIGYLFSIFSIIGIIIRPIVGNLIDKKGRKTGIIIGIILYILANGFFTIAQDFKFLLIARMFQAFGASFLWISIDTVISDISNKEDRGKNFGILNESMARGGMAGSFIGLTVLFTGKFNNPFKYIFMIFLFTSLMALYYSIKEVPETISYKKEIESGRIKNEKGLKYFLIIMGTISLISSLTAPIYLLYLQENITSNLNQISYLFLPAGILSTILPRKFGIISDKQGREKTIIIGLLLNGVLQMLIPFSLNYYSFLILYTMISIVVMFYSPALSSLIIDFVGEEKRGRSYGLYSFASGIGAAIGPIIGSYIYENINNNIVFYLKGGLLIVIVSIVCYIYIKNKKDFQNDEIVELR